MRRSTAPYTMAASAALLLALGAGASNAAAQQSGGTSRDTAAAPGAAAAEAALRRTLADFIAAWNAHDARAFSRAFAEDADFTNVRGAGAHGRAAIEAFHAPVFATRFKDTHQEITHATVRFVRPDVAAVDARWEMTGARDPEGREQPRRTGLLNFVMTPADGRWLILVMHNMDVPAGP